MSRRRQRQSESVFWLSYADLITALLLVFILVIVVLIIRQRDRERDFQAQREQVSARVDELRLLRTALASRLKDAKDEANDQLGYSAFEFDEDRQVVYVEDTTWFSPGESDLGEKARRELEVFYPHLHAALFDEAELLEGRPAAEFLASIEIQGHTDADWEGAPLWSWANYEKNSDLSRKRAAAIADHLGRTFSRDEAHPWRHFFAFVQTAGKSWSAAYCAGEPLAPHSFRTPGKLPCPSGQTSTDKERSRRVSFGFRLDDSEVLAAIRGIVTETPGGTPE